MEELSFWKILQISLVMPVLLAMSVVMVAFFIERLMFFMKMAKVDVHLFKTIKKHLLEGDLPAAQAVAEKARGLIPEALTAVLHVGQTGDRVKMDHVLTLYFQRTQSLLSRRLGLFGTFSFISPLLGLLGTVLGVMTAFRDLALTGTGGPGVVAAGISEALVATAAGIFVAVTSALIYNYFNFKLKHVLNSLNIFGQEITLLVTMGKDL